MSTFCLFSACSAIVHAVLHIVRACSDRKTGIDLAEYAAPAVDVGAAIGDVAVGNRFMVGVMMRIRTAALWVAFAGAYSLSAAGASAQTAPQGMRTAQPAATEISAQQRVRPPTRLRVYPNYAPGPDGVYPRYFPGRNAVRECNATYVQEFRPSGTVIVPRHELLLASRLAQIPARRADQSGADHQRRGSIDDDGHSQLGGAAGGARTTAWALGRERRIGPQRSGCR